MQYESWKGDTGMEGFIGDEKPGNYQRGSSGEGSSQVKYVQNCQKEACYFVKKI